MPGYWVFSISHREMSSESTGREHLVMVIREMSEVSHRRAHYSYAQKSCKVCHTAPVLRFI